MHTHLREVPNEDEEGDHATERAKYEQELECVEGCRQSVRSYMLRSSKSNIVY